MNKNPRLQAFLAEQFAAIREIIELLQDTLKNTTWEHAYLTAAGTYLSNIYMGVESCLKMALETEGWHIAKNDYWHKTLLELAQEKGLIPLNEYKTVRGMLSFRHFIVHGYVSTLREHDIRQNASEAINSFYNIEDWLMKRYAVTEWDISEAKKRRLAERMQFR
jgi:uncharacterized protein YutE (UPF0331/DUF86 family)